MPLILAIEPDKRQATQIKAIVHTRLGAELVLADSVDGALRALGDRVPDLILTTALLSPRDEAALNDRLRALERAAQFVQTLTTPMLAAPATRKRAGGMLAALRREKPKEVAAEGCDPAVFADQVAAYLERAAVEREAHALAIADAVESANTRPAPPVEVSSFESEFLLDPAAVVAEDGAPQPVLLAPEPPIKRPLEDFPTERTVSSFETLPPAPEVSDRRADSVIYAPERYEPVNPERYEPVNEIVAPLPEPVVQPVVVRAEISDPEPFATTQPLQAWTSEPVATYEPPVRQQPTVKKEVAVVSEPTNSKDEDLEIFDLDLDALVRQSEEQATVLEAVEEKPSAPPQESVDSESTSSLGLEDAAGAEDTDLQVYDLDLSALLGEPSDEPTNVEDPEQEISFESTAELPADTREESVVEAPRRATADADDDDVEVYDLDLNLLMDQPAEPAPVKKPAPPPAPTPRRPATEQVQAKPAAPANAPEPPVTSNVVEMKARSDGPGKKAVDVPPAPSRDADFEDEPTRREIEEDEHTVIDSGIWAPLLTGAHRLWPRLEGGVAQPPRLAVVGPSEAPVVAVLPPLSPSAPKRPEWLNVIKALRRDNSRPQADADASPTPAPVAAAETPGWHDIPEAPVEARTDVARQVKTASTPAQASEPAHAPAPEPASWTQTNAADAPSRSKRRRLAKKAKKAKVVQDDWGFFDAEEGGFSALVTKLDQLNTHK